MNQEYSDVNNSIHPNGFECDVATNEDLNNHENLNLVHTSGIPERVINFKRKKVKELGEGDTSVLLVDDHTVIQPEVEFHIKEEEDLEGEGGSEYVDEEGTSYLIFEPKSSEDEYIGYVDTDLEPGEIRPSNWNNVGNNISSNKYPTQGSILYICSICNKQFSQKGNLYRHFLIHTGDKPHMCKLCGHKFTQKSNLDKHLDTHNGAKKFICGVCDKGFVQKANLMRHIRVHTGEKPFECNLCGHKFTQKGNLNKHMELHNNSNTNTTCDTCGCSFSSYNAKLRHEITHHNKKSQDSDKDYLRNDCTECPATFKNRIALSKHMRCHKKSKEKQQYTRNESSE